MFGCQGTSDRRDYDHVIPRYAFAAPQHLVNSMVAPAACRALLIMPWTNHGRIQQKIPSGRSADRSREAEDSRPAVPRGEHSRASVMGLLLDVSPCAHVPAGTLRIHSFGCLKVCLARR